MTTITIDRAVVEQALEALESCQDGDYTTGDVLRQSFDEQAVNAAIVALWAALAQEQPNPPGCEHCNHPLYAATKCRVCGRVTEPEAEPTYKTYPIRMHFEWVGDRWLFDDNPIDNGEWCVTLGDGGWMIYPKMEQAEPALEPEPVDVGLLEYRGNSVAFIYQKMTAYRTGIDAAWDAFRANGLHPDGKTSLADMIAKHTAPPQRKPLMQDLDAPLTLNGVALYPRPEPLTQEQLYALYDEHATHQEEGPAMSGWFDFARAIERAHGIGDNT